MLQNIRNNVQGTMAKGIILLITIPFILTGAETLLSSSGSQKVAKVNGEEITQQQLDEELLLLKRRLMSQMGDNIDPAQLEDNRLRSPAIESLINRITLEQAAKNSGMTVVEAELNRMITQMPEFQQDGRFSAQLYTAVLSSAGLSPVLYKNLFRSDVLRGQYIGGVAASDFLTSKELELNARFLYQTRDIRYLTLDLDKQVQKTTVSNDELQTFYEENAYQFTTPEQVVVNYIEIKQADFSPEISADELQLAYENEVQNFSAQEQRQVSHILRSFNNDSEEQEARQLLEALQERLAAGEDFAELAKQESEDFGSKSQGGFLGELNTGGFPEAFVAAANQLEQGAVSDIIKTEAGLHLIKVEQIADAEAPSFEERRDALLAELQEAKASPLFVAAVERLKDVSFNAPDLQQPAEVLETSVKESPALTRQGGEGIFSNPKVYQAAFSDSVLNSGYNSDVIELAADHVVVLRVQKHIPEEVQALEQVRDVATQQLKRVKAKQALIAQAQSLEEALQVGADVEQLANEHKLDWQVLLASSRNVTGSAADVVSAAFALPIVDEGHRAIDQVMMRNGNIGVLAVDNIKPGKLDDLPLQEQSSLRQYMAQTKGMESFQLLQSQLERNAKIKRY